jgi:hypothetical protein
VHIRNTHAKVAVKGLLAPVHLIGTHIHYTRNTHTKVAVKSLLAPGTLNRIADRRKG